MVPFPGLWGNPCYKSHSHHRYQQHEETGRKGEANTQMRMRRDVLDKVPAGADTPHPPRTRPRSPSLSLRSTRAMAKPLMAAAAGAGLAPLQRLLLAVALLFAGASERAAAYYYESTPEQLQCTDSITNAVAVPGPGTVYSQPSVGTQHCWASSRAQSRRATRAERKVAPLSAERSTDPTTITTTGLRLGAAPLHERLHEGGGGHRHVRRPRLRHVRGGVRGVRPERPGLGS